MINKIKIVFAIIVILIFGYIIFNSNATAPQEIVQNTEDIISDELLDKQKDNIPPPSPISTDKANADVIVKTDNAKKHQAIEGFGATHQTLVYGGSLGDTLSPSQRSRALDAIFNQVKITTGQIPTVFEASSNSNISTFFNNQANDNNDPSNLNWSGFSSVLGDIFKQKVVDVAGSNFNLYPDVRVNLIWKNKWLGDIKSADYNIFLDEIAEQVLAGITYWKNTYGVEPIYAMLFNEPLSGNAELGHASTQTVVDIIKRSGARLRQAGFNKVKFVVPGEETEFKSLDTAKAIFADPEARQYVGVIAYHPYPYLSTYSWPLNILETSGKGLPDQSRILVRNQLRDLAKQHGVKLFMTEVSSGPAAQSKPINPLSYDVFRARAIHIHDEFLYADASAFFGMNSMWDAKSQKDHFKGRGFEDDLFASEGDIVLVDNNVADKVYITGMGYAIGHYARFINKGAVRIETTSSDSLVQVTAFRDDVQKRMVWVVINNNASDKSVKFNTNAVQLSANLSGEQSTKTAYWRKLPVFAIDVSNNFITTLPAESVTTIVGQIKK
ncbi:MAG: glycoside hydrolase family 30 beta sandwich domain-containing protein [Patescibacteria group bacterium]